MRKKNPSTPTPQDTTPPPPSTLHPPHAPRPRKLRADLALVQSGLAPTREKAQVLILAGLVYHRERRVEKASQTVDSESPLEVRGKACPFVSRGGVKLEAALDAFGIEVEGLTCADIGASTGGFTHCLLLRGASKVYAVDVGKGLLDVALRSDPRVVPMEGVNARHLDSGAFPEPVEVVVVDASFISLRLLLPAIRRTAPTAGVVALVKPQFEVGKGRVGKGGIVRDDALREGALAEVAEAARSLGYTVGGSIRSPITGAKGNVEFLLHLTPGEDPGG